MNPKNLTLILKISAVLWLIWGIVHAFAGIMTISFIMSGDIASAIGGIADAVEPASLLMEYPEAAGAILGQHGFNLLWFGIVTTIGAIFIWRKNRNAIFLNALVGGLADLGYFLFLDLGGYVHFVPGTVMTLISSLAIIMSLYVNFKSDNLRRLA